MASKKICIGVGIPMMIVGALIVLILAPIEIELVDTIEFVGSLIGMLGVVFFILGLFYSKEAVTH